MLLPEALLRAIVAALSLLVAGLAVPAAAQLGSVEPASPIALEPCVVPAAQPALSQLESQRNDGASHRCAARQTALGPGDFVVRMALPQPVQANGLRLRWTSTWQDAIELRFRFDDGDVRSVSLTQDRAAAFIQTGAIVQVPVPVHRGKLTGIEARVDNAANLRGVMLGPTLATSDQAAGEGQKLAWLYGAFLGLCAALCIYNLMIWTALRKSYLLAYCGMLVAIIVYATSSSGLLADLVPGLANNDRIRINYLSLGLVGCFALAFARIFIEPQVFSRPMRIAAWVVGGGMLGASLAFALLAPWQIAVLDHLYFGSFAVALLFLMAAFWRGLRLGGIYTRLYIVSWSAPLGLSLMRVLHGFGYIPQSFLLDNSTLIAMSVEAMLSSMIIAHRIRTVQRDRDMAQLRESEALELADTDPLTGLLNRRALMRVATPAAPGKWRLVLVDIDHFKKVNDRAGHDAGDQVIATVASIIRASLRKGAVAARIGGEEFAILFPAIGEERRTYASLLGHIRSTTMPEGIAITVSMGLADGPLGPDETLWRQLYRRADAALYEAKRKGRNRLETAPGDDAADSGTPDVARAA